MRGIHLAAFILCFSLAIGMLGSIGWFGMVGVHPDGGLEEQREETVSTANESVGASDAGSEEFSMIRGAMDALSTLRLLTTGVYGALTNLGVHGAVAAPIQAIVTFTVFISFVQIIRGMRFS